MSSFMSNPQAYNIVTENELSQVLANYSSEFIISIVEEAMKRRFAQVPIIPSPNVVGAWEQNFKAIRAEYGSDSTQEVARVREETYREIIDMICKEFNLSFTIDDTVDLYTAAFHLYDVFVCNFIENMTSFFANFIYKERSELYDSLGLADLKKNKDSSTIYSKKAYKDIKLVVINANIDMVINNICNLDISFDDVLRYVFGNNSDMLRYISTIVSDNANFFADYYKPIIVGDIRAEVATSIRFKLHNLAAAHDQTVSNTEIMQQGGDITE